MGKTTRRFDKRLNMVVDDDKVAPDSIVGEKAGADPEKKDSHRPQFVKRVDPELSLGHMRSAYSKAREMGDKHEALAKARREGKTPQ